MARERIVVGIDVGTTKVCTLIAAVSAEDQLEIIGAGITPSRGMRRGVVVDVDDAVQAIGASVQKAEQQSGFKIMSAYVGISGAHVSSTNSHGVVAVRRADNVITADDIDRALEAAKVVNLPQDREVIHVVPRHFVIDGQEGINNPAGMLGRRLEVETTVVTGAQTAIHNLTRCIEQVNVGIDELVVQPIAAGEAVLTTAEKDMGVALIDLGGGTTDAGVFIDGSVAYVSSIPVGGNHISNDIAVGLRTPFLAADELKIRHGYAISEAIEEDRTIDIASYDAGDGGPVSRRALAEIIEARLDETFELVRDSLERGGFEIGRSGREGGLSAGVVLVGGTAQLQGIRRLASEVFSTPVRIGTPTGMFGLVESISNPAFATSVGLLKWGLTQADEFGGVHGDGVVGRLREWLRSFFP
ncbi:MAG: cell division protein FtsA [Chloroflexi bacterium]|nr:cell division protein FtsA [Chloroflexota bacterium]